MAAGQPVEPGARQMELAQQLDATGSRVGHCLLSLAHFEEGEGGAATRETVSDQHHRALGAGQNLPVNTRDLG